MTVYTPDSETIFRLSPSATIFQASPRLFCMTFCNFAAQIEKNKDYADHLQFLREVRHGVTQQIDD